MATASRPKPGLTAPGLAFPFIAITALFFIFGFITNMSQGMVPELKQIFEVQHLATWQANLATSAFFLAYLLFSTPAAWLIEKIGYKKTMIVSLVGQLVGALMFLPAAQMVSFPLFLAAIFVLGAGVTALQTSANPYVASLGPAETAPQRVTLAQAINTLGGTIAPWAVATFILTSTFLDPAIVAQQSPEEQHAYQMSIANTVRMPFIVVALALAVLGVALALSKLPVIKSEEKKVSEGAGQRSIFSYKHTVYAAIGIFLYVGVEVGLATSMVFYFHDTTHGALGIMTQQSAQKIVALYWLGALIGRLMSPWMMSLMKPGKLVGLFGVAAVVMVVLSMIVPGYAAVVTLLLVGFCNSVMFPTIFALGIAELGPMTSRGSGIITTMVVGGAVLPVMISWVFEHYNFKVALLIPVVCYLYIAWFGVSGSKPSQVEA